MIVQHSGQQVVGSAYCVEVSGEVKVDILHGNDLCIAASGSAALDAEYRSQRGLAQGNDYILAQFLQTIGKAYGSGGLALSGRGGIDGSYKDQLAVGSGALFKQTIIHLCLVVAVKFQILRVNTGSFGDLGDGTHGSRLCDFDVGFEFHNFFLLSCVLK